MNIKLYAAIVMTATTLFSGGLLWFATVKAQEQQASPVHVWEQSRHTVPATNDGSSKLVIVYKLQGGGKTRCTAVLFWAQQMAPIGDVPCE